VGADDVLDPMGVRTEPDPDAALRSEDDLLPP